ncbi:MAG: hypothetical protein QOF72_1378 [Blastocatellia bacterium]|nr:hypothetical protein [Blastocatellia bacterium]
MPTLIEHFGFWPLVAQRLARMAEEPNQSPLHLTAGRSTKKVDG